MSAFYIAYSILTIGGYNDFTIYIPGIIAFALFSTASCCIMSTINTKKIYFGIITLLLFVVINGIIFYLWNHARILFNMEYNC